MTSRHLEDSEVGYRRSIAGIGSKSAPLELVAGFAQVEGGRKAGRCLGRADRMARRAALGVFRKPWCCR